MLQPTKIFATIATAFLLPSCTVLECDGQPHFCGGLWQDPEACECPADDEAGEIPDGPLVDRLCQLEPGGTCMLNLLADAAAAKAPNIKGIGNNLANMQDVTFDGVCEGYTAIWPCGISDDPGLLVDPLAGEGVDLDAFEFLCGNCPSVFASADNPPESQWPAFPEEFAWCTPLKSGYASGWPSDWISPWYLDYQTPYSVGQPCGAPLPEPPDDELLAHVVTSPEGMATTWMNDAGMGLCDDDGDCAYLDNEDGTSEGQCALWPFWRHYVDGAWIDTPRGCFANTLDNGGVVPPIPTALDSAGQPAIACVDDVCTITDTLIESIAADPFDASVGLDWAVARNAGGMVEWDVELTRVDPWSVAGVAGLAVGDRANLGEIMRAAEALAEGSEAELELDRVDGHVVYTLIPIVQ